MMSRIRDVQLMRTIALALAAVALIGSAGGAWAEDVEGTYQRRGAYSLQAEILATEGAAPFAGRFTTGHPGDPSHCGGVFAATGQEIMKGQLVFTGDAKGGKACKVTIVGSGANTITMTSENCSAYHGASCDFDGQLQRIYKARR